MDVDIDRVLKKHPNRVPVYVRKSPKCKSDIEDIEKHKYLIPNDMTMGNFMCMIRRHIKLKPNQALFVLISKHNVLVPNGQTFGDLYNTYKDEDKMLHLDFTGENTFG